MFRERTGIPWRDLPTRFGPWKTVYQRKRRWALDGTWAQVCDALRIDCDIAEGDDWTLGVDSTVIRAHQHAAGARRELPKELADEVDDAVGGKGGRRIRANRVIVRRSVGPAAG